MTDATELLHDIIKVQPDGSPMTPHLQAAIDEIKHHKGRAHSKDAEIATLQQALAERDEEIEHLKATAGAVTAGPDLAKIKADLSVASKAFIRPPDPLDAPTGSTSWDVSTNDAANKDPSS